MILATFLAWSEFPDKIALNSIGRLTDRGCSCLLLEFSVTELTVLVKSAALSSLIYWEAKMHRNLWLTVSSISCNQLPAAFTIMFSMPNICLWIWFACVKKCIHSFHFVFQMKNDVTKQHKNDYYTPCLYFKCRPELLFGKNYLKITYIEII